MSTTSYENFNPYTTMQRPATRIYIMGTEYKYLDAQARSSTDKQCEHSTN
jgi:hypothetical protein